MPWAVGDVDRFKKGLTPGQKKKWVEIANGALASCRLRNGSDCEAYAIRTANSKIGVSEATEASRRHAEAPGGPDTRTDTLEVFVHTHGKESIMNEAIVSATSISAQQERVRAALVAKVRIGTDGPFPYIKDWLTDGSLIYELDGKSYRVSWAEVDDAVTLGEPVEVDQVWDTQEAVLEFNAVVNLTEAHISRDGVVPVKVIEPGWGSSGYYAPNVLERDAGVFEGVQMFWDHPRKSDQEELPERSLNDLAGVLHGVQWKESGPDGPGIYGHAKIFSPFKERMRDLAPHVGLSILASGKLSEGEHEGRRGPVIEAITQARSVDFVTVAGAGGKVVSLFESLRGTASGEEVQEDMNEDAKKLQEALTAKDTELSETKTKLNEVQTQLAEANTELARYRDGDIVREAHSHIEGKVATAQIPDMTKARIVENLSKNPPVKEGKLDVEALDAAIEEAVKTEAEYLASVVGSGKIKGLGESASEDDEATEVKESEAKLQGAFTRMGLSEEGVKTATSGR